MNGERGFNPEASKEAELQEIQKKIDNVIQQIIEHWNEDKGWSLGLTGEKSKKQSFEKEEGEIVDEINAANQSTFEHKKELSESGLIKTVFKGRKLKKDIAESEAEIEALRSKRKELSDKARETHSAFEHQKAVLEQLLTDYYMKIGNSRNVRDFMEKFPYANISQPSYHDLKSGKTSHEDRQKEIEDQVAYISDFTKMFDMYGADIYKREIKN